MVCYVALALPVSDPHKLDIMHRLCVIDCEVAELMSSDTKWPGILYRQ